MFCVVDPKHHLRDSPLKSDDAFVMLVGVGG